MSTNETDKSQEYVNRSLFGFLKIAIVSMVTKVLNFGFGVLLARRISKEAFGIAKIYLEFAFLLILYFPRETIRKTAQKYCPDVDPNIESKRYYITVQLCWILNFIFNLVSVIAFFVFVYFGSENLHEVKMHLFLYILSANLELLAEPIIIYMNIKILADQKLKAMTISNYIRIISNYLFALIFGMDLWSFTLSRLLSSSVYLIYLINLAVKDFKLNLKDLLPDLEEFKSLIGGTNSELRLIFNSFVKSNVIKMILTYTERIVLSFFLQIPDTDKSEYSFVTDNFAIIIRYGLEPAEETVYNLTNKLDKTKSNNETEAKTTDYDKNPRFKILFGFLRALSIFGAIVVAYIIVVGREAIALVFTEKWANPSTIQILHTYSVYVAVIAINGTLEAYSNAVSDAASMNRFNNFMVLNSALLILLSISLSKSSVVGLIYANLIAMAIRIYMNISSILEKDNNSLLEKLRFLKQAVLKVETLISIIAFAVIANLIKPKSSNFFAVLVCGVVCLINLAVVYVLERHKLKQSFKMETKDQ